METLEGTYSRTMAADRAPGERVQQTALGACGPMTEFVNSASQGPVEQASGAELQGLSAGEFSHPSAVLAVTTLSGSEKRALLASWASDACAVEGRPAWRWLPGTPAPVVVDDVLTSLQALDRLGLH